MKKHKQIDFSAVEFVEFFSPSFKNFFYFFSVPVLHGEVDKDGASGST